MCHDAPAVSSSVRFPHPSTVRKRAHIHATYWTLCFFGCSRVMIMMAAFSAIVFSRAYLLSLFWSACGRASSPSSSSSYILHSFNICGPTIVSAAILLPFFLNSSYIKEVNVLCSAGLFCHRAVGRPPHAHLLFIFAQAIVFASYTEIYVIMLKYFPIDTDSNT